jgi:hypothetical protein
MESNGFGEIYASSNWGVVDSENGFGIIYRGLVYNEIYFNFNISNIQFGLLGIGVLSADLNINWGETLGYQNEVDVNVSVYILFIQNPNTENEIITYSDIINLSQQFISTRTEYINPIIFNNVNEFSLPYEFRIELETPKHNPFINPNPLVNDIWIFNQPQWQ